jgi:putative addiction module CopG family antidote
MLRTGASAQLTAQPTFGIASTVKFQYPVEMNIELTPAQRAFVQRAIQSGRLRSETEAIEQALALWEERERQRAELLASLDDAEASLARGEGREVTKESMQRLASEVKDRARARLLAELTSGR